MIAALVITLIVATPISILWTIGIDKMKNEHPKA